MLANLTTAGMLAGGVGIFLLAVGMITDGLKLAAGSGLRSLLGRWTRSPGYGVFTGFTITALVQSSSAITVATIGFVNAGLLNLTQALGVIFGANIGTTVTGWLVALIGFEINISAFALPLIGIGMLLKLSGGRSRWSAIGTALVGFGLFFIGIQILKDAFEGIVSTLDAGRFTVDGIAGLLLYIGLGFLMTVLTQSSSAAIAITLTAASGGLLGLYAAGAMVIGANVGTTSTAVLSVLGATANAKRVAAAHVLFNGITGVVALILMPVMFYVVNVLTGLLNIEPLPTVTLALFHTIFNILGVLLLLPFTARLARFLKKRFTTREEILGQPRYLDKNVSTTPDLALNAAVLELSHLDHLTRELCGQVLLAQQANDKELRALHDAVLKLVIAVGEFVMNLQRSAIPLAVAEALPKVLRCSQYYLMAAELAQEIRSYHEQVANIHDEQIRATQADFYNEVTALINMADTGNQEFSLPELEQATTQFESHYDEQKEQNLRRSVAIGLPVADVSNLIENNSNVRRMVTHVSKGVGVLSKLLAQVNSEFRDKTEQQELQESVA